MEQRDLTTDFTDACDPNYTPSTLRWAGNVIRSSVYEWEQAVADLMSNNMGSGTQFDYSVSYTCGHWGDEEYLWEYSYYDVYEPIKPGMRTLVVLYYKPAGEKSLAGIE